MLTWHWKSGLINLLVKCFINKLKRKKRCKACCQIPSHNITACHFLFYLEQKPKKYNINGLLTCNQASFILFWVRTLSEAKQPLAVSSTESFGKMRNGKERSPYRDTSASKTADSETVLEETAEYITPTKLHLSAPWTVITWGNSEDFKLRK